MSRNNDIDRLIDAGLNRYSAGDLDGALVAWEQVLAIEPANPQATSYLGYVRVNYEALQFAARTPVAADSASQGAIFAIDDSPQYVIGSSELDSGSVVTEPIRRVPALDSFGDDWFFEDDVALGTLQRSRTQSIDLSPASLAELSLQFSLEDGEALEVDESVSFESLTTEYAATAQRSSVDEPGPKRTYSPDVTRGARVSRPPQLDVRVRSPSSAPRERPASQTGESRPSKPTLGPGDADNNAIERALQELLPLTEDPTGATDDLIASLPVPRRAATARGSEQSLAGSGALAPAAFADGSASTIDPLRKDPSTTPPYFAPPPLPGSVADAGDPAPSSAREALGDPGAISGADRPGVEFWDELLAGNGAQRSAAHTPSAAGDGVGDIEIPDLPGWAPVIEDVPVDTPTGELRHAPLEAVDEDDDNLPTRQSARAITARSVSRTRSGASTNRDLVARNPPRADPIDACAAQILDEIDADGGRTDEPKDDRIRRRLTALLERATAWNKTDPDRAVCAVELALSEDPTSALAQKLIHRNRETIMAVFQSYLGNLDRRPQLERPLHELESVSITPRAAFLLSRIDGELTLDEILDVSGMPRLEAYRHLCQLFLRKILG